MYSGAQSVRLAIDSEELVLLLEPATKLTEKQLVEGEDIGTPIDDLKYDSNAGPESSTHLEKSQMKEKKKGKRRDASRALPAYLNKETQIGINSLLREKGIVAWSIQELQLTSLPKKHSFEIKGTLHRCYPSRTSGSPSS